MQLKEYLNQRNPLDHTEKLILILRQIFPGLLNILQMKIAYIALSCPSKFTRGYGFPLSLDPTDLAKFNLDGLAALATKTDQYRES